MAKNTRKPLCRWHSWSAWYLCFHVLDDCILWERSRHASMSAVRKAFEPGSNLYCQRLCEIGACVAQQRQTRGAAKRARRATQRPNAKETDDEEEDFNHVDEEGEEAEPSSESPESGHEESDSDFQPNIVSPLATRQTPIAPSRQITRYSLIGSRFVLLLSFVVFASRMKATSSPTKILRSSNLRCTPPPF